MSIELCPRRLASNSASFLLSLFFTYERSEGQRWPDGRGEIYQPLKLRNAFNLLAGFYHNERELKEKQAQKDK